MGVKPEDLEPQAEFVIDRVQTGLDVLEEYGGPLLDRYGKTALVVGVAVVAAVGVALIVARRRRRSMTLTERLPEAVGARLGSSISTLRSAAQRMTR